MIENQNESLYHYGVKGMQWGKHLPGVFDRYDNSYNRLNKISYTISKNSPNVSSSNNSMYTKSPYSISTNKNSVSNSSNSANSKVTSSSTAKSNGLMSMKDIKAVNEKNSAAYKSSGEKTEDTKSEKKGSSNKKSTNTDKSTENKTNTNYKVTKNSTDEEIIRNALGKDYDKVQQKLLKKMQEKGTTNLTREDLAECVGENFDKIDKQVNGDKAKRDKLKSETAKNVTNKQPTDETIESEAYKVIRGEYGNGTDRKNTLGSNYQAVQNKVNEILKKRKVTASTSAKKDNDSITEVKHSDSKLYLVHHGISGQKWGSRNGPPYPLNAKSHSSSEKKAGTKGWTVEAKKDIKLMSNEELRSAVNRKQLESRYKQLSAESPENKRRIQNARTANKAIRTTGKIAGTVASANRLKAYDKLQDIDDSDMTKREKKLAKREIKENQNAKKAEVVNIATNQVANAQGVIKPSIKYEHDISKMSDKELRDLVDRMTLETQYNSYFNQQGQSKVDKILDAAGDITSIAGTAISLALLIKGIKRG